MAARIDSNTPGAADREQTRIEPDGIADLIAEGQRVRAMCATVAQTLAITKDLAAELQERADTLAKLIAIQQRLLDEHARGADRSHAIRESDATALDQARLEGAKLAARTAAHLINNDLTATIILDQMVRKQIESGQPVDLRLLDDAIAGARRAARHLKGLQQITRLELEPGYGTSPPVVDVDRSR